MQELRERSSEGSQCVDTGLVGKEESVCPIILTPIRFYLLLQLAVAEDV